MDETAHLETFYNHKSIKLIGKEYVVQTIRVGQVFHPKVYLLIKKDGYKVLVGSGNLTIAGFFTNKEVFSSTEHLLDEEDNLKLLNAIWCLIDELNDPLSVRSETHNSISQALRMKLDESIVWSEEDLETGVFIHNRRQSLLSQMKRLMRDKVHHVTVLSPYFEANHRVFSKIMTEFHPEKVTFILQDRHNNFDVHAFSKVVEKHKVEYELKRLSFKGERHFRNHAKVMIFAAENHDIVVWGSANFTSAALSKTAETGNLEAVMIQKTEKNQWKSELIDGNVLIEQMNLDEFKFETSRDFSHHSLARLRLVDGVQNESGLELKLDSIIDIDRLKLITNEKDTYEIENFLVEIKSGRSTITIANESCPASYQNSMFVSLAIESGNEILFTNNLWVNHPLELERMRTDEAVLNKRATFRNPDFTSREQVLLILDYIFKELKLERKDLPKPLFKLGSRESKDRQNADELEYFPEEDTDQFDNWSINPLSHIDYDLYNSYVHAILENLGLAGFTSTQPYREKAPEDHNHLMTSSDYKDRIMERFRGFIHKYIRGISDEEYMGRVPLESVFWHYKVITSSFLKISIDNEKEQILDHVFARQVYKDLHDRILRSIPDFITTDAQKNAFKTDLLPVVLAEQLVGYFDFNSKGQVRDAAKQREWLEYTVQYIEKNIIEFKNELRLDLADQVVVFSELFGGLENQSTEDILKLLDSCFGYIRIQSLLEKLKELVKVSEVSISNNSMPTVRLVTNEKGEQLNWIVLSALYWQIITREYYDEILFRVSVSYPETKGTRIKTVYLFDKVKKSLFSANFYSNGNELYRVKRNIDTVMIKKCYRQSKTDVLKGDVAHSPSELLLKRFEC